MSTTVAWAPHGSGLWQPWWNAYQEANAQAQGVGFSELVKVESLPCLCRMLCNKMDSVAMRAKSAVE